MKQYMPCEVQFIILAIVSFLYSGSCQIHVVGYLLVGQLRLVLLVGYVQQRILSTLQAVFRVLGLVDGLVGTWCTVSLGIKGRAYFRDRVLSKTSGCQETSSISLVVFGYPCEPTGHVGKENAKQLGVLLYRTNNDGISCIWILLLLLSQSNLLNKLSNIQNFVRGLRPPETKERIGIHPPEKYKNYTPQ